MGPAGEELDQAVRAGDISRVVELLAPATEAQRRALAQRVLTLRRRLERDRVYITGDWAGAEKRYRAQQAAASAAILGTCSLGAIQKGRGKELSAWVTVPEAYDALAARRPAWLAEWADWMLDEGCTWHALEFTSPWLLIRRLVREELIPHPTTDGYIYSMIGCYRPELWGAAYERAGPPEPDNGAHGARALMRILLDDPDLLDDEVWRLFEVEGISGASLANDGKTWQTVLAELSAEGRLDRQRLLTASLDALRRDFAPFRAGWFSQFHESLKPTPDERAARVDAYLALVPSRAPATVSFAVRALSAVDKAGRLPASAAVQHLGPALGAKEKGTAALALRVLGRAAQGDPSARAGAVLAAAGALAHSSPDVQRQALDLIEQHGSGTDPELHDAVAGHLDSIAPSLRPRAMGLALVETVAAPSEPAVSPGDDEALLGRARRLVPRWTALAGVPEATADVRGGELRAPGLRLDALQVPRLDPDRRIEPIQDLDALTDVFAAVIENGGPPRDVERVLDGVSRLCAQRPTTFDRRTSALRKRAKELLGGESGRGPLVGPIPTAICHVVVSWLDGVRFGPAVYTSPLMRLAYQLSMLGFFTDRALEVGNRAAGKQPGPLLSAPTHSGGWIDPRAAAVRFCGRAGGGDARQGWMSRLLSRTPASAAPCIGRLDAIQALLRLAPDHREEALSLAADAQGETGDALRYALGGPARIGNDAALWVAAARARSPFGDDAMVERRFPRLGPGAGRAAHAQIRWAPGRDPRSSAPAVVCEPELPDGLRADMPTVLHHSWHQSWDWYAEPAGPLVPLLSWIWPAGRSAWYAAGAALIGSNVNWVQARWGDIHYIALAADPEADLDENGLDMLAFGLAAKEAGQSAAAIDASMAAITDGRMTGVELGGALARTARLNHLTPARWARTLGEVARAGALHLAAVRGALELLLASAPQRKPAEMVALLELTHELCTQSGVPLADEAARSWLAGVGGSGKAAKLARALCTRRPGEVSMLRRAALEQLRGRIERAERWQRIAEA